MGEEQKHVTVYTLSTCGWCRKVKTLLKEMEVEHECVDVDLLTGDEQKQAREKVKEYNPRGSFPTIVVNNGEEVIIGFQEEKVREVLGK